jgi:hypothetical protein
VAVPGTTWTLPRYELALLAAEHAHRNGLDLAIELVTTESEPLGVFGAAPSTAVARRLALAGIHARYASFAHEVDDGRLHLEPEGPLDVDLAQGGLATQQADVAAAGSPAATSAAGEAATTAAARGPVHGRDRV